MVAATTLLYECRTYRGSSKAANSGLNSSPISRTMIVLKSSKPESIHVLLRSLRATCKSYAVSSNRKPKQRNDTAARRRQRAPSLVALPFPPRTERVSRHICSRRPMHVTRAAEGQLGVIHYRSELDSQAGKGTSRTATVKSRLVVY